MRRLLLLVSAILFTDTMFFAAITPLLPTYVDDFGLSKSAAGVLAAAYPAGTFVGALPGGWLAARFGVRRTVLIGLAGIVVSSLAFAFAPSIAVLDIARFVQGVTGAATWAGAIGWLIAASPRERRGELIGSAMAAAIVGVIFGPVLGGIAAAVGPEAGFSAVAVLGACLFAWTCPCASTRWERAWRSSRGPSSGRRCWRRSSARPWVACRTAADVSCRS